MMHAREDLSILSLLTFINLHVAKYSYDAPLYTPFYTKVLVILHKSSCHLIGKC